MSTRTFLPPVLLLCGAAFFGCGGDSGGLTGDATRPGRLVMQREGAHAARLVDAPARASWCAADSTLVIVAVDREWAGGLALRVGWPPGAAKVLLVRPGLESERSATAALRSMGDSAGPALIGASGKLWLEADAAPTGRFDLIVAAASGGPVRVTGGFRAVPVTEGCAGGPPPQ